MELSNLSWIYVILTNSNAFSEAILQFLTFRERMNLYLFYELRVISASSRITIDNVIAEDHRFGSRKRILYLWFLKNLISAGSWFVYMRIVVDMFGKID